MIEGMLGVAVGLVVAYIIIQVTDFEASEPKKSEWVGGVSASKWPPEERRLM